MKRVGYWASSWVLVGLVAGGCADSKPEGAVERRQGAVVFEKVTVPAGTNVVVDLMGGVAAINGVSLRFFSVPASFDVAVIDSQPLPAASPTGAYEVSDTRFWYIGASQAVPSPFEICIHYDSGEVDAFPGETVEDRRRVASIPVRGRVVGAQGVDGDQDQVGPLPRACAAAGQDGQGGEGQERAAAACPHRRRRLTSPLR